jgi:hypothetical protein
MVVGGAPQGSSLRSATRSVVRRIGIVALIGVIAAVLLPIIPRIPGSAPAAQAHGGHTDPGAACFINSMRTPPRYGSGGVPLGFQPSWAFSCEYGPVTSTVTDVSFGVTSTDECTQGRRSAAP